MRLQLNLTFACGLLLGALLVLSIRSCSCKKAPAAIIVKSDTVFKKIVDTIYSYKPRPAEFIPLYIPGPIVERPGDPVDSSAIIAAWEARNYFWQQPVDTGAILSRFFAAPVYSDTIPVKYGYAVVNDTVSQNRIQKRGFFLVQQIPMVTNTVASKPRNQLYLGFDLAGRTDSARFLFGAALALKTKKDKILELGAMKDLAGPLYYRAGFKWKLSFRK